MQFIVLKKNSLIFFSFIVLTIVASSIWLLTKKESVTTFHPSDKMREISIVTAEFKTTTKDGKEIEAYRWDPGTIYVEKDEKVLLRIYGVNGQEHPFIIEGTDIKGTVKKGEETAVELQFKEEGIYRLVCMSHPDKGSSGPMIANIIVD
ncbi:cupredoxin domain-containing protein [Robertmurraya andreesenii]|uniref:Plastocyanin n=1 Tax=Anoxybacillus andreesenii TaxID=1325932 RepID=A0ABT9V6Y1_9BACL|nr:cupredoxin domain-containing protein [Robertmurraya andreesenii]MDQ0156687.1 plastocyanin [Robertmurraya andreesenii]